MNEGYSPGNIDNKAPTKRKGNHYSGKYLYDSTFS